MDDDGRGSYIDVDDLPGQVIMSLQRQVSELSRGARSSGGDVDRLRQERNELREELERAQIDGMMRVSENDAWLQKLATDATAAADACKEAAERAERAERRSREAVQQAERCVSRVRAPCRAGDAPL